MITADNKKFESKEFAMQVIARGGFVDFCSGSGKTYYVDTVNLRANHIMSNGYFKSGFSNGNDWEASYETKEEWEKEKHAAEERRKIWEEKVKSDLKTIIPNIYDGTCFITKVQSEVFAVMHVYEMEGEEKT
jgi:hypothetical protein